jgi:hypothetical protein
MKELDIKYRDGRFAGLCIDGVQVEGISQMSFTHNVGEEPATLSLTLAVTGRECLIAPDVDRRSLVSVRKRFGVDTVEFAEMLTKNDQIKGQGGG